MSESLTKKEKIKRKTEIKKFFSLSSSVVECKGSKLRYKENGLSYNRVVFCLVKNFKNSVDRNKAKRIIREIYRKNKGLLKTGYDLAFILFPGKNETESRYNEFQKLVSKAKLFTNS